MSKWLTALIIFLCPLMLLANVPGNRLDNINFTLSAKNWASTQNALVRVSIHATLSSSDLVKARANIVTNLNKIASGDWHITQFDRSKDNSGLDTLAVEAEARIPQAQLNPVYTNAQSISKPGTTYTISALDFSPSLTDIEQVKSQLREQLYQKINDELTRINKIYPTQHYSVNEVTFMDTFGNNPIQPLYKQAPNQLMAMATGSDSNLVVSNEVRMQVMVKVSSNRDSGAAVAH